MSLIQQALEKTNRAQETRTTTPAPARKLWDRDPMGAALEQQLIRVQESHAARQGLYRKIAVSVFLAFSIGSFVYFEIRQAPRVAPPRIENTSVSAAPRVIAVPQTPVKIYSGNIYRLTGITDLGGNGVAVINGRLLGVGDALDGRTTVKKIGNGEVLLDVEGRELRLVL
jgi:hypothetical protein